MVKWWRPGGRSAPSASPRVPRRPGWLPVLLVALSAVLVTPSVAAGAAATPIVDSASAVVPQHSLLRDSTPADGAQLQKPPRQVILQFSDRVRETGLGLTAMGEQGSVDLTDVTVAERQVSASWPATADSGDYAVNYRIVSADGHVISGAINFTVSTPGQTEEPAGIAPSPSTAQSADDAQAPQGVPSWIWLTVALVAITAVGLVMLRRSDR